jgi:hypothetical protein
MKYAERLTTATTKPSAADGDHIAPKPVAAVAPTFSRRKNTTPKPASFSSRAFCE